MESAKSFAWTQEALDRLRTAFERAGKGSMARTARKLGLHKNYYSELWRRERVDVGVFVSTLRELGMSPSAVFAELEGDPGGVGLWGPIAEQPSPETWRAVRLAYRRMRAELAGIDRVAELEEADLEAVDAAGPSLDAEWLADLDGRRQDEPEAVASGVAAGIDRVEASLLPRALGVWASAKCLLLELESAAYLNRWAVKLAQTAGDSTTAADLYLRRSYILADAGDHEWALTLSELATGIFSRLRDEAGEGRSLVDAARWLHYLGRYQESIAAFKRALDLLPASEAQYRFGALQSLGMGYLVLGEFDKAEKCADQASALLKVAAGSQDRGKFLWFRAALSRRLGRLDEAEEYFRQVVGIFRELHYGEAALAGVDLLQVILEQGKSGEARQVCQSLWPLLEPLEDNPIIGAAFGELIRAGAYGRLGLDLMRRIRTRIEDGKKRKDARARQLWRALAVKL